MLENLNHGPGVLDEGPGEPQSRTRRTKSMTQNIRSRTWRIAFTEQNGLPNLEERNHEIVK